MTIPDVEHIARQYFERMRWPDGVACPLCEYGDKIVKLAEDGSMGPGWYHCGVCRRMFTVRTGTVFERSHVPHRHWLRVIAAFAAEDDPNLCALQRETGLTYKTILRMADLIRPERAKPWRVKAKRRWTAARRRPMKNAPTYEDRGDFSSGA